MAKLTPEFADRVRQICADALPMQIIRREGNQSWWDYVRPEQKLTDEEIIGITCLKKYGTGACFTDRSRVRLHEPCPRGEEFKEKLRIREGNSITLL